MRLVNTSRCTYRLTAVVVLAAVLVWVSLGCEEDVPPPTQTELCAYPSDTAVVIQSAGLNGVRLTTGPLLKFQIIDGRWFDFSTWRDRYPAAKVLITARLTDVGTISKIDSLCRDYGEPAALDAVWRYLKTWEYDCGCKTGLIKYYLNASDWRFRTITNDINERREYVNCPNVDPGSGWLCRVWASSGDDLDIDCP